MPNADHRVALPEGDRQYHIGLGPGELADYILLPGDPDRTARIASRFESCEFERRNREFASATGHYKGQRVSIVSTGIGTDNVEIVVAEILAIVDRPTFIRVGSCGALQPEIQLGDLVISSGAVRLEATTSFFVHDGYPAVADYEATWRSSRRPRGSATGRTSGSRPRPRASSARRAVRSRSFPSATLTSPRSSRGSECSTSRWRHRHVMVLAGLARCRAGVVCGVFAQRVTGDS